MRCARATSLLVAAALTMSVGACTSDRGDPEASSADGPRPVLVPLDSTAWIDAVDRAESYDVIAGGPTDARVVAAVVSHGDGPAGVRVWTADEGGAAGSPVDVPGVIGDVTSVAADGTADLAALAGSVWSDGRTSSYLVTSRDRVAWDAVELPPDVAQTRVTDVAVVDDTTVVLTGAGVAGRQPAVSVVDTVSSDASTWALPTSPDTDTSLTGVAAVGAQMVVTAAVGQRGEPAGQVSFVSLDRGSTFEGPFPVAAAGATVSGVVRARSAWLATGSQRGADGVQVPMAWSSADGRTWQQDGERLVTQEDGTTYAEGSDAAFGAPVARAGEVGVAATGLRRRVLFTGRETDGRWWSSQAWIGRFPGVDDTAMYMLDPVSGGVLAVGDGSGLREYQFNEEGTDVEETVLVDAPAPYRVAALVTEGSTVRVTLTASRFTVVGSWWNTLPGTLQGQVTGDQVTAGRWGPDALAAAGYAVSATDPATGATVVALTTLADDGSAMPAEGWVSVDAVHWEPTTGFEGGSNRTVVALEHLDSGWYLATQEESEPAGDPAWTVTLWTSADGVTWTQVAAGLTAEGATEAVVADLCPDGAGVVLVGSTRTVAGVVTATWWRLDEGVWAARTVEAAPGSWFDGCSVDGSTVTATGSSAGRSATWSTTDLTAFGLPDLLDDGLLRGRPVEVDQGWAAAGSVDTTDYDGPVLWASPDGLEWTWTAVPAPTAAAGVHVEALDDGVLVTADVSAGVMAWRTRDS